MPAVGSTKCPKLDNTIKQQIPKDGKDADCALSKLQALLLDAVGPLANLLEQQQAGRLTTKAAAEATTQALRFLGNAHANISVEWRKRVATHLNKDLRPLIEEPESFVAAAPLLFGKEFERTAKEHIESLKSLRKLNGSSGGPSRPFFRQGRPHNYHPAARGGGAFRGGSRGKGRYRPYHSGGKENHHPGKSTSHT